MYIKRIQHRDIQCFQVHVFILYPHKQVSRQNDVYSFLILVISGFNLKVKKIPAGIYKSQRHLRSYGGTV